MEEVDVYRMPNPYEGTSANVGAKTRKKIALIAVLILTTVLLVVAFFYAYELVRDPDIAAYADEQISIFGLDDDDLVVTPKELSKLKCTQISVNGTGMGESGESKAGMVSAYGPTLKTVCEAFGHEPTDFRRIKFTCKDGYEVVIRGETLTYDIYLSIASGKNALIDKQQPLRVVIPDEASGKWGYGVTEITFY